MRYLSLFSGIGGFEDAIYQVFGQKATCVGYSEIDKHAIKEYERHYPDHQNLGDINLLKKKDIDKLGKIDLVVGGFPCNDLSSANFNKRHGLDGIKSGLFWKMLDILKWVKRNNSHFQIIIENNASMAHKWRDVITEELRKTLKRDVFYNFIDSSQFVLQRRKRYFWTFVLLPEYSGSRLKSQTFNHVLDPLKKINMKELRVPSFIIKTKNKPYGDGNQGIIWNEEKNEFVKSSYSTRWKSSLSLIENGYIKCVTTVRNDNILLDTRPNNAILRYLSKEELNKLFGFSKNNYVDSNVSSIYFRLYGMSVVPLVIVYILSHLDL